MGSYISIARQRMFSVLWSDLRQYNEKTTIFDSSVGSENSSREISIRNKAKAGQIMICELLLPVL
jgi:hypothetical protein